MSHVETVLDGPGAEVDDVQVFFTAGRQHMDLTSNLLHRKPHTRGEVNVKGVLKGKSQAVFWGLIRIEPGAQGANAFQSERSLILEEGPRSNAIPSLEIEANDVRCTHAAATSQIDEEQLFYLRSRGLPEDEAQKLIVDGFFEPLIEKISLPFVQTRLRMLIDHKWRSER
jgi:Fe-S cluster assembly protein SufD